MLVAMTQIYREDRGQSYSMRMGEQVAEMVVEDHAKRAAQPGLRRGSIR